MISSMYCGLLWADGEREAGWLCSPRLHSILVPMSAIGVQRYSAATCVTVFLRVLLSRPDGDRSQPLA